MSDRFFLDTNILVYSFDQNNEAKRDRAQALIEQALDTREGVISYQVMQEFLNVALRKFKQPFTGHQARLYLDQVLAPLCEVYFNLGLLKKALSLLDAYKFSFFDSVIVASAIQSDCRTLYTEDMQDGLKVEKLRLVNPFQ